MSVGQLFGNTGNLLSGFGSGFGGGQGFGGWQQSGNGGFDGGQKSGKGGHGGFGGGQKSWQGGKGGQKFGGQCCGGNGLCGWQCCGGKGCQGSLQQGLHLHQGAVQTFGALYGLLLPEQNLSDVQEEHLTWFSFSIKFSF